MSRSKEVETAVGEAPTLEQLAAGLRQIVAEPTEQERAAAELAAVERQIAEQREQDGKAAAKKRIDGISRAAGSVAASLDSDVERLVQLLTQTGAAIERLNDRYAQFVTLTVEGAALVDRFGVAGPKLPVVVAPARRAVSFDAIPPLAASHRPREPERETDDTGLRQRRSYAEVAGTEGFKIIVAAGLKPFPELTDRQRELIAERAAERRPVVVSGYDLSKIPSNVPLGSL